MKSHGARTGWRTLASTSCLLLLAGLSCKYNVTLPWVSADANAPVSAPDTSFQVPDTSFDQSSAPSMDVSLSSPDGRVCPGKDYWERTAHLEEVQILVAIDRSTSMQREFENSISKTQAAWAALYNSVDRHPRVLFATTSFPINCGGTMCCAGYYLPPASPGLRTDAAMGCGPYDAGCLPSSNDSPSHQALQNANSYINASRTNGYGGENSTLVLITDQNPGCPSDSSPDNNPCGTAIDHTKRLGNQGVQVFVMFPNAENRPTPDCLNTIARQNARSFSDSQQLFPVKNPLELRSQLETIVSTIERKICRFSVGPITADQIEQVRIGKDTIPRTSWDLESPSGGIVLTGNACDRILASAKYPEVKVGVCSAGNGQGWQ